MRLIIAVFCVGFFHPCFADEFRLLDCRPKAFVHQVQDRIDYALHRGDLLQAEAPTLSLEEFLDLQTRVSQCDESYFGPRRAKFRERLNELQSELTKKIADLKSESEKKALACHPATQEQCRKDVMAAFEAAIARFKSRIDQDTQFYTDQIHMTEKEPFQSVLAAYRAALFADQINHLLRGLVQASHARLVSDRITLVNGDERILISDGPVTKLTRHITPEERVTLVRKFGMPIPEKIVSVCDADLCLDPELIYANFNEKELRAGYAVVEYTDDDYTYTASLSFNLIAPFSVATLKQAEELLSRPNSEATLYDSSDKTGRHELGRIRFEVKSALKDSLRP